MIEEPKPVRLHPFEFVLAIGAVLGIIYLSMADVVASDTATLLVAIAVTSYLFFAYTKSPRIEEAGMLIVTLLGTIRIFLHVTGILVWSIMQ